MLPVFTMTQYNWGETCHASSEGRPLSLVTIWQVSPLSRKGNRIFEMLSLDSSFLKGLMISSDSESGFRWSSLVNTPEDQGSSGLAFALWGLMADLQIVSLFSCARTRQVLS